MGTQIGNTNQTEELTPLNHESEDSGDASETNEIHSEVSWSDARSI